MLVMKIPICLYLSAFILFPLNAIEPEVQHTAVSDMYQYYYTMKINMVHNMARTLLLLDVDNM